LWGKNKKSGSNKRAYPSEKERAESPLMFRHNLLVRTGAGAKEEGTHERMWSNCKEIYSEEKERRRQENKIG